MSRLIDPSGNAKIDVSGCILEAIYQVKGRFLLLTTDNSPYEETLHLCLFDVNYRILDQADIYNAYTSGIVENISIEDNQTLRFQFLGQQTFRVRIESQPRFQAGRLLPSGPVHYPTRGLKSYLSISSVKQP